MQRLIKNHNLKFESNQQFFDYRDTMHEIVRSGANRSSCHNFIYDDQRNTRQSFNLQQSHRNTESPLANKKSLQQKSCNYFQGTIGSLDQDSQNETVSTKFKTSKALGMYINEGGPLGHQTPIPGHGVRSVNPQNRLKHQRDTLGSVLREDDSMLRDTVEADFRTHYQQTDEAEQTIGWESAQLQKSQDYTAIKPISNYDEIIQRTAPTAKTFQ